MAYKDAILPIETEGTKWPKCEGTRGIRKLEGGTLRDACWGGGEGRCEYK